MAKRIIVVDDDINFAKMTKWTLEATGQYEARALSMASQCIAVAHDFKPDLIILDCMMPGWDGGEVAARLEQDPHLRDVPVLFVTATVASKEVQGSSCYRGLRTYLPKSVALKELVDAIEETIAAATPANQPATLPAGS